jgi:hypothetical protein
MRVFVEGVGLCGPGLQSWEAALPVLAGEQDYVQAAAAPLPSSLLPPNERRRATQIVKFALAVGAEAFAASGRDPRVTQTVFTSSGGDGDTIHAIMSTLAASARELSPTRFHNSVHNAAAGYWSILTGSKAASSAICAHDDSFAAGLLEAMALLAAGEAAVALIAYDVQYPSPLAELRPIGAAFAAALVLTRAASASAICSVELDLLAEPRSDTEMALPGLEILRATTPAARCLPLLAALAIGQAAEVSLGYLGNMAIGLRVSPMPGVLA